MFCPQFSSSCLLQWEEALAFACEPELVAYLGCVTPRGQTTLGVCESGEKNTSSLLSAFARELVFASIKNVGKEPGVVANAFKTSIWEASGSL